MRGAIRRQVDAVTYARGTERRLRAAASSGTPVVCGPWLSEIGFEVLYWIPMLRRELARHEIPPEQVVCVSRGGADPWYADLCGRYADALDHHTPEEVKASQGERVAELGHQKQTAPTSFERRVLARVAESLDLDDYVLVHPRLMYERFRFFWASSRPSSKVVRHMDFRPLPKPPAHEGGPEPGSGYVALKAYFSDCFPDTPANRERLARLIEDLADPGPVVVLSSGVDIDEHEELRPDESGGVVDARALMRPRGNLGVQTRLIAGADRLVATYGGFSYLGPFLGVDSISFYSERNFNPGHLEVMRHAEPALGGASFRVLDAAEVAP